MKKNTIVGIVLFLVVASGLSYFFWNKEVQKKEKEKEEEELAYEYELSETIRILEFSTDTAVSLAATYQEYWGAIIDGGITFPKLSEGLGIDVDTLTEMTDDSKTSRYMYDVSGLKQGEFDTVISMVKLAKTEDESLILSQHQIITASISHIKNPIEKYQSNYDSILEVYELYDRLVSLSTAPSGSYIEYSKNINSVYESLSSKIATTKLQLD